MKQMKLKEYWFKENIIEKNDAAFLGDFADRDTENEQIAAWRNMGFDLKVGKAMNESSETHHAIFCSNYKEMLKVYGSLMPNLNQAKVDETLDKYFLKND